MDKREELFSEIESVIDLADFYGNKWNLLILFSLHKGKCRFNILLKGLIGISKRTLSETLKKFESSGILTRTVFAEVPPRVEYELTEKGKLISSLVTNLFEQNKQLTSEIPIAKQSESIDVIQSEEAHSIDLNIEPIVDEIIELQTENIQEIENEVEVPEESLIIPVAGINMQEPKNNETPKIKFTGLSGSIKENESSENTETGIGDNIKVAVPIIAEEGPEIKDDNIYSSSSEDDEILAELSKAADFNTHNKPQQTEEEPKKLVNPLRKLFGHNRKEGEE